MATTHRAHCLGVAGANVELGTKCPLVELALRVRLALAELYPGDNKSQKRCQVHGDGAEGHRDDDV